MKNKYFDKIRLNFGQSLLVGDKTDAVSMSQLNDIVSSNHQLTVENFGLFDSATSNFNTFFPDSKPEDFLPKDSDYIKPVFRMLSKVIVNKKFNPVDFTKNSVLKNSMPKLLGQTVYPNHEANVGNELGTVSNVSWQESYKTDSGITVPAGINAELTIDAKSHPKIARALNMKPPAIHSNSVTVAFSWEPSHKFKTEDDFFRNIGLMGPDNTIVRRIATDILFYNETSLVRHGADPFAQKIEKGKIVNPEYANSIYSLAYTDAEKPKPFYFSYKEDLVELAETIPPIQNNNLSLNSSQMKQTYLQLAALAGITLNSELDDDATKLAFETELTKLKGNADLLKSAQDQIASLTTEIDSLKTQVSEKKPLAELGETTISNLRTETQRIYGIIKNSSPDPAIVNTINSVDHATLTALHKQYSEQLEELFPMECNSCHGTAMTRRKTSIKETTGGQGSSVKTFTQVVTDLALKKRKAQAPAFLQSPSE